MTRYLSLLIIVFTAVLLARPAVGQTATDRRNSIVAEVNDKIITRQMVTDAMGREAELLRRQYARQPQLFGQKYTQLQADTLEALIRRELVLIEYQEKGYKLPESIIEPGDSHQVPPAKRHDIRGIRTVSAGENHSNGHARPVHIEGEHCHIPTTDRGILRGQQGYVSLRHRDSAPDHFSR
jgi:hypothetical protein